MASMTNELTESAQYAADSGTPSPHILSSNMDRAHRAGLWARAHGLTPQEVRAGRGHRIILNRDYVLDFGKDENAPTITHK